MNSVNLAPLLNNVKCQRSAMLALACGTGYGLLSLRLLPNCVMRGWFFLTVLTTVFPASALLYFIDPIRYLGVPRRVVQRICIAVMSSAFKLVSFLNPQIKTVIKFDKNEKGEQIKGWKDITRSGNAYALNHTSFWDVFMLIQVMPLHFLVETRTLMKASLRQIPIFGGCFDRVGHFPVYFKSDEDGNFQVDKDKQAEVQVLVNEHIEKGGNLAIFPEGAVNKNPETLKPFRFGTFATIFEHKMPLYYVVSVGNEKTWPPQCVCGGYPSDIRIRCGAYPIDFATQDSKQVAQEMQVFMQKVRAELVEELENEKKNKKNKKTVTEKPAPQLATA